MLTEFCTPISSWCCLTLRNMCCGVCTTQTMIAKKRLYTTGVTSTIFKEHDILYFASCVIPPPRVLARWKWYFLIAGTSWMGAVACAKHRWSHDSIGPRYVPGLEHRPKPVTLHADVCSYARGWMFDRFFFWKTEPFRPKYVRISIFFL